MADESRGQRALGWGEERTPTTTIGDAWNNEINTWIN